MTLFSNKCTIQCIFSNCRIIIKIAKRFVYFENLKNNIFTFLLQFAIHFFQLSFYNKNFYNNLILPKKINERLKLLTLFLLHSINIKDCSWLSLKIRDVDRKYIFFKIILPTPLCFLMANRSFTYYSQYLDERLKCSFSSCIGLELFL